MKGYVSPMEVTLTPAQIVEAIGDLNMKDRMRLADIVNDKWPPNWDSLTDFLTPIERFYQGLSVSPGDQLTVDGATGAIVVWTYGPPPIYPIIDGTGTPHLDPELQYWFADALETVRIREFRSQVDVGTCGYVTRNHITLKWHETLYQVPFEKF